MTSIDQNSILSELVEQLGKNYVIVGQELVQRYDHIWRMNIPLIAMAVILPRTTEDVSTILKICNKHAQPIVIHGGMTGLVNNLENISN